MQQHIFFVFVVLFGLVLKVSTVAGAEGEFSGNNESNSQVSLSDSEDTSDAATTSSLSASGNPPVELVPARAVEKPTVVYAYDQQAAAIISGKQAREDGSTRVSIIPLIGTTFYSGGWRKNINNQYSLGLALDVPLSPWISAELEAGHAKSSISYSSFKHDFKQFNLGANMKLYLVRESVIRPYLGLGLMVVEYEDMSRGPFYRYQSYDQTIGAAQAMIGADVGVSEKIALGVRGAYVLPFINRPEVKDNGSYSLPYYEEAAAINTTFYKVMGTVKVVF